MGERRFVSAAGVRPMHVREARGQRIYLVPQRHYSSTVTVAGRHQSLVLVPPHVPAHTNYE